MQSAPLTFHIFSTTTTEASEVQARLLELSTGILQSNHAHSILLRDLISRQDAVLSRQDEILEEIRDRSSPSTSTLSGTGGSMVSTRPSSAGSQPSDRDNCNSDNASIMSKRSTFSLRLGRPSYFEDLKTSRAYKRLRHFGLGIDSSSDSVFSFDSVCSTGNWSMLSDIVGGSISLTDCGTESPN